MQISLNSSSSWFSEFLNKFELSRAGTSANIQSMEGLRGLAVFLVFVTHYITLFAPYTNRNYELQHVLNEINRFGFVGVDLFFILSGYLIYGTLISKPINYVSFMKRRVQRLYPAFTVVFVIYVVLSVALPALSKIPSGWANATWYLIANYLMLPPIVPMGNLIAVAWSLSYEMFFYLITPLAIMALRLPNWDPKNRILLFLAGTLTILVFCALYGGHVRMIMFLAGMILFELQKVVGTRGPTAITGLIALLLSPLYLIPNEYSPSGKALGSLLLFLTFPVLVFTCLQRDGTWLTKFFCWRPLRLLGNMSYSFYLLHGLFLNGATRAAQAVIQPTGNDYLTFWGLLPLALLGSLIASALLFLLIEKPMSLQPK